MVARRLPPGIEARSGSFRVRWRDPLGRQRSATFASQREAADHLARVRTEMRSGDYIDPAAGRVTFDAWAEMWSRGRVVARTTAVTERGLLERWAGPYFGPMPLRGITTAVVQVWVAQLLERELAPSTIARAFGVVRHVLQGAVDKGLIRVNPCKRVKLPAAAADERVFITPAQFLQLLPHVPARYRALVVLAYQGGLRWSELAGLRAHRVDLVAKHVQVLEVAQETQGLITFGPPKTRAGQRIVTLPAVAVEELRRHLVKFPVDGDRGLVFTSPKGAALSRVTFSNRVWRGQIRKDRPTNYLGVVMKAGLDPAPRFHDLRHSHVAALIATGTDAKAIQRRMGHSSIRITYDLYGHLLPETDGRLITGLDEQLADMPAHPDLLELGEQLEAMYGNQED